MPNRRETNGQHANGIMVKDLDVLHSGWVLKKKRKKMQGYAKRFLVLTTDGTLTYALSPDKPTRDSIKIPHASVTTSKRHGTLHIDSGASVFHIKMLGGADFEMWRNRLRSFIPEQSDGVKHRIYVASSDGKDLEPVDLTHLFMASQSVGDLITAVNNKVKQMQHDKIDQPSMLSMVNPLGGGKESQLNQLATLLDNLMAEHANLKHALESKIPASEIPRGTMHNVQSRTVAASNHRMSISSFNTTADDATFYDADATLGDEGDESSRDESSGAEDNGEDDDEESDNDAADEPGEGAGGKEIGYRQQLPAPVSGDEVSLFSMLKKNVGKDLSTVSFPVSFNCPLSLLQAAAEEYEYAPDLLERAAKAKNDWVERICLVAAFAVSGYACTKLRASRKPFNPLLGETYECVREDRNLRFIAEKVAHHPPVLALYADGKGWKCEGWSVVKNKFWGKSLELIPEGNLRLTFDDGDVFSFQKPSSFMRNLLAGNKYLEHVGELTVTNEETGQRAVVEFKEGNMWGGSGSRNVVEGTVYDENGKKVTTLKGKWSEGLARQKDADNFQQLWEVNEMPKDTDKYYGFTYFAMSLNEMTKDIDGKLPPTDTRLRPDQRAFEEGDVDTAESLKQKLEGQQRERRQAGKTGKPRWFHEDKKDNPEWKYGGEEGYTYFKSRAKAFGDEERAKKEEGEDPGKSGAEAWGDAPKIFETD